MVSKKMQQLVRSLQLKKFRKKENLFLVEGEKSVLELLSANFSIKTLIATPLFLNSCHSAWLQGFLPEKPLQIIQTDADTLGSLSSLSTNRTALALVTIPEDSKPIPNTNEWILALDAVNDPGNLGTIIRIADWYGIRNIVCSPDTVDLYNPKVINATKGSFLRVNIYYTSLPDFIQQSKLPAYGADLQGTSVHSFKFPKSGILVMGSESHGISADLAQILTGRLTIPAYGAAESLNVGVATAIICDNLRQRY